MTFALEQHLQRFALDSGRREELKWFAAILMVVDHVNGYLLASAYPAMYELGRLVYPLFALVLAYNLAGGDEATLRRVLRRLLIFGALAQPFTMLLRYPTMPGAIAEAAAWWHANILFTFALSVAAALVLGRTHGPTNRRFATAILLVLVGGLLVDFRWAGIVYFLSAYYLFVHRSSGMLAMFSFANVGLVIENGSLASLAALPVVLLLATGKGSVARRPGLFYVFYPAHLALIWLAAQL